MIIKGVEFSFTDFLLAQGGNKYGTVGSSCIHTSCISIRVVEFKQGRRLARCSKKQVLQQHYYLSKILNCIQSLSNFLLIDMPDYPPSANIKKTFIHIHDVSVQNFCYKFKMSITDRTWLLSVFCLVEGNKTCKMIPLWGISINFPILERTFCTWQ